VCLLCLIRAFRPNAAVVTFFTHPPAAAKLPSQVSSKPEEMTQSREPPEMDRIKRFARYLDSLQASPSGKARYDSLVRLRPGLIDSLKLIQPLIHP
jgi:hypothetical protein